MTSAMYPLALSLLLLTCTLAEDLPANLDRPSSGLHRLASRQDSSVEQVWPPNGPSTFDLDNGPAIDDPYVSAMLFSMVKCDPGWIVDHCQQLATTNNSAIAYDSSTVPFSVYDANVVRQVYNVTNSQEMEPWWAIGYATAIAQAQADPNFAMGEYVSWTYLVKFRALSGFNAQFLEPDMLTDLVRVAERANETPMIYIPTDGSKYDGATVLSIENSFSNGSYQLWAPKTNTSASQRFIVDQSYFTESFGSMLTLSDFQRWTPSAYAW